MNTSKKTTLSIASTPGVAKTHRRVGLAVHTGVKAGGLVVGTLAKMALPDLDAGG